MLRKIAAVSLAVSFVAMATSGILMMDEAAAQVEGED